MVASAQPALQPPDGQPPEGQPPDRQPTGPRRTPRRQATEAEARALASTLRMRILRLCVDDELTNKEIAHRLGRNPGSVLHHVRRLVDTGFLTALPERLGSRGSREIPYRATGKSWELTGFKERLPGLPSPSQVMLQTFLEELAEADGEMREASRLALTLNAGHFEEFTERIGAILDEFAARPHDPDGTRWSVFFAMHEDRRGEHTS
jgi:DNA-binding transcriptional ArsR family regulator